MSFLHICWEEIHKYTAELKLCRDSMKLLVLSLCLVAVLATKSAQLERQQALEDALDALADELDEIVTAEKGLQYESSSAGLHLL